MQRVIIKRKGKLYMLSLENYNKLIELIHNIQPVREFKTEQTLISYYVKNYNASPENFIVIKK